MWLYLLLLVSSTYSLNCSQKMIEQRDVYYWIASPDSIIDKKTNSCSSEFMLNISKYHTAISGLGPYLWKVNVVNSTDPEVVYEFNSGVKCYNELVEKYPQISIGASGGISECWNNNCQAKVIGRNPKYFINSLLSYIRGLKLDRVWIDFETKNLNSNDTLHLNGLFNQLSNDISLYRYAGCVHNGEPAYLNETCKQFVNGAPNVIVQGAGTYWDNTPDGFKSILMDMISDIGVENIGRLSVAVCPNGCADYNEITQEQLYERMDLICNLNITSISAFTLDSILQLEGINGTGIRWMNALMYYRTGIKS